MYQADKSMRKLDLIIQALINIRFCIVLQPIAKIRCGITMMEFNLKNFSAVCSD